MMMMMMMLAQCRAPKPHRKLDSDILKPTVSSSSSKSFTAKAELQDQLDQAGCNLTGLRNMPASMRLTFSWQNEHDVVLYLSCRHRGSRGHDCVI